MPDDVAKTLHEHNACYTIVQLNCALIFLFMLSLRDIGVPADLVLFFLVISFCIATATV